MSGEAAAIRAGLPPARTMWTLPPAVQRETRCKLELAAAIDAFASAKADAIFYKARAVPGASELACWPPRLVLEAATRRLARARASVRT